MVKLCRRIAVSETVYSYLNNECREKWFKNNPSYDGKTMTMEQLQRSFIKTYLGMFKLYDRNHKRNNSEL